LLQVIEFPLTLLRWLAEALLGWGGGHEEKKQENLLNSRMWNLTPGERKVLEGVERKMGKIVWAVKIRFVYIGKKEVFKKAKILQSFIGAFKQYNTNDMLALKLETKKTGMSSSLYFMGAYRNNIRKGRMVRAYRDRSNWAGILPYYLNTEELATLWHMPVSQDVKAPQVKKTESKKTEPPINLPMV
jgi:hypothetical protein